MSPILATAAAALVDYYGPVPAAAIFFTAWAVRALAWRRSNPPLLRVAAATGILVSLGLLGTFPQFFRLIGG